MEQGIGLCVREEGREVEWVVEVSDAKGGAAVSGRRVAGQVGLIELIAVDKGWNDDARRLKAIGWDAMEVVVGWSMVVIGMGWPRVGS